MRYLTHLVVFLLELELEKCVKCGICNGFCPINKLTRTQRYSPKGFIMQAKSILKNELSYDESIYSCILCEKCEEACPLNIRITEMIVEARKAINNKRYTPDFLNMYLENLYRTGNIFISKKGTRTKQVSNDLLLFKGCIANAFLNEEVKIVRKVLEVLNINYFELSKERCCGAVLDKLGLTVDAKKVYNENILAFKDARTVLTLCPTCMEMFKKMVNTTTIVDQLLNLLHEKAVFLRGLDLKVAYVKSMYKDLDEKSKYLLNKIPKLRLSAEVDGFKCYQVNPKNKNVCVKILQEQIENLLNQEIYVFISASPINLYLIKQMSLKIPFVIDSISKLVLISLGLIRPT